MYISCSRNVQFLNKNVKFLYRDIYINLFRKLHNHRTAISCTSEFQLNSQYLVF